MKLFFGLGNPGSEYKNTRHNLGHLIIFELIKNLKLKIKNSPKLKSELVKDGDNIFAISTEYMNLSGTSVQKVATFYKISPENIYIIHDDLDLPVGEWRLQFDRGPAGHNGVKSIIEKLGTQAFWRIRIGIGHPRLAGAEGESGPSVEDYVLKPFTSEEKIIVNSLLKELTFDKLV